MVEITPVLHELCGDSSVLPELPELSSGVVMPPSVEEVRSDPHEILGVASPLSETLGFKKSGVVVVDVSLSIESGGHVVPISDEVARSSLLATVSGAVVVREVFDFIATLAATCPAFDVE
jgi:hypothetical protein